MLSRTALCCLGLLLARGALLAQPAYLVKDIKASETPLAEAIANLTNFATRSADAGGALYFGADDGIHGQELWRSDGTAAGTWMVRDLCPGRCSGYHQFDEIVAFGDQVVFVANDGVQRGLWISDGTAAGTVLVHSPGGFPSWLAVANGLVFFSVSTTGCCAGGALWRSDGTPAGTFAIRDFSAPGQRQPERLIALGPLLIFFADDGLTGGEPWRSDGTAAGTTLVADIAPGSASGVQLDAQPFPVQRGLARLGTILLFPANDGTHGLELWTTDGTALGTGMIKDVLSGSGDSRPYYLCTAGAEVFFRAEGTQFDGDLWATDGSEVGTRRVSDAAPIFFSQCIGNRVYFASQSISTGTELWTSDGTETGTHLVEDIRPGSPGALDLSFGVGVGTVGSRLLFWAYDPALGFEPWVSDGSLEGTFSLGDLALGALSSAASTFLYTLPWQFGGEALFFAFATGHGWEPWRTDGTPEGTLLLAETNTQLSSQNKIFDHWLSPGLLDHQERLAFVADDGAHGYELWRSDGSAGGTTIVRDIYPGELSGGFIGFTFPVSLLGSVFLTGQDAAAGSEPWVSDLTTDGTRMLADTLPGPDPGDPLGFAERDGLVYFSSANQGWETDATPEGTHPTASPLPTPPPRFNACVAFEVTAEALGTTFYAATDPDHGTELWARPAAGGPGSLVRDIRPGTESSGPSCLTATPGGVYFVADDDAHGRELWWSDGTFDGTSLARDIAPGPASSLPEELRVVDGVLLFSAWDPDRGRELWGSNGSGASTIRLQDIAPGWVSSSPSEFTISGPNVYFYATDAVHGFELWALPRAALAELVSGGLYFHTIPPCRLLDTRAGPPPQLAPLVLEVHDRCGIPPSALAIAANFTVVGPSAPAELRVGPANSADRATVVAFAAGQVRAGNGVVRLATDGSGRVAVAAPGVETHLVVDVSGYFQ